MKRSVAVLVLSAVCCFADTVDLKNGDRVTGTILKKDGKSLTIKTDAFGVVTTPWDKVAAIRTDQSVHVELADGEEHEGPLKPGGDGQEILAGGDPLSFDLNEVAAIRNQDEQREYERLIAPSWTDLWAGTANFGFAGTKGNAQTLTITSGLNAARVTRADKSTVYFNAIRASALIEDVAAITARAVRGGWAYNRNIRRKLFLNTFNDYEFDRFQNLDLRFVLGGGAGYTVWKLERSRLDLLAGGAFNREAFAESPEDVNGLVRRSGEAYLGDDFTLKLNSTTAFFQNARYFPNFSQPGEYRLNFDMGANTQLTKWLTWNTTVSNRYLSNPVRGRQNNDFIYSTGFGVTFSR